jgi:hypothetical protein
MKQIPITCKGTSYLELKELKHFQGNLKELRKAEFEKLKTSIIRKGFRFPVLVWKDRVLDGHARIYTVKEMLKEGYSIGKIPVVEIEAKNEREAKELILLVSSRYGRVTEEGLYEFIIDGKLDFGELKQEIDLPEINFERFITGYGQENKGNGGGSQTFLKCPFCGYEWKEE